MKRYAKRLAALALSALMVLALAACGGGSAGGKTTGIYLTPGRLSYQNMRPQYNYYLTTFDQQELTLMDDDTYCLVISSSCFSALELAESTNDAKGNERTNYIVKFYGTYTSQVNDLDEDLLDVTLSAPTRVVRSQDQTYWLDTDNWNDDMGKAVVPGTIDTTTGAAVADPNAEPWTAEQYLESVAYPETTIQVNTKTASFDFTPAFMGE
ncbi:MAG TPA: hypothetical protein IAA56_01695 [Candidatus Galloscillospira excrementavium]|nr:hypothetical protein [Candidatus Galloscillospira excrementavium]